MSGADEILLQLCDQAQTHAVTRNSSTWTVEAQNSPWSDDEDLGHRVV